MKDNIAFYLADALNSGEGADLQIIREIEKKETFTFPNDYVALMVESNGLEGEVGENGWILLFPVEELVETNEDYKLLMQEIPEYFLIGKDSADTGYAINKKDKTYHSFGLMSNFKTDPIEFCGNSLEEFVEYLYNR